MTFTENWGCAKLCTQYFICIVSFTPQLSAVKDFPHLIDGETEAWRNNFSRLHSELSAGAGIWTLTV